MPTYDYEHIGDGCKLGKRFELVHGMAESAKDTCPECGAPIQRLIRPVGISTPRGNSDLKGMGFTKLVRRDKGVYENVTALDGESKVMEAGKPETMPDLKRRIED